MPEPCIPITEALHLTQVVGARPSHISPGAPVRQVTKWADADRYCRKSCRHIATQHGINDSNRINYLSNGACSIYMLAYSVCKRNNSDNSASDGPQPSEYQISI